MCITAGLAIGLAAQALKPAAPPNPSQRLFQQAKAGLGPLPAQDRPVVMASIVRLELPLFRQQALADYKTLFQMALDLPTPTPTTQFYYYLKQQAELGSVIALTRQKQFQAALDLARTADTTRSYLYDWILRGAAGQWPLAKLTDLIQECVQSDGSFPYDGAMAVVKRDKSDVITLHQLLRQIYAAAANQTNLIDFGLTGGFAALQAGHELAPALDAELETSLTGLITRSGSQARPINPSGMSKLLVLLRQVAPNRAQELEAQFPALVQVPPPPSRYYDVGPDGKFRDNLGAPPEETAANLAKTDPAGALAVALGQSDPQHRFSTLSAVALALATSQPQLARQAAHDANAMLSDDFLKVGTVAASATTLAQALNKMGNQAGAHTLLLRLLDVADEKASDFDRIYRAAPLDAPTGASPSEWENSQVSLGSQLGFAPATEDSVEVYRAAGQLDFVLAAQRAQALPCDVLRPLVEANVAAGWKP